MPSATDKAGRLQAISAIEASSNGQRGATSAATKRKNAPKEDENDDEDDGSGSDTGSDVVRVPSDS